MTPSQNLKNSQSPSCSALLQRPDAVLFDYDGVLVASENIHLSAWMQLLAELGLPEDKKGKKIIQEGVGKTAPQVLADLLNQHQPNWSPDQYMIPDLVQRKNDFYVALAQKDLQTYPGVREGIEWLRSQNIATAIVSNGRRRDLLQTVKSLNLSPLFDEIVSRDDVPAFKPDPTPYLFAAATLGKDPSRCLAIEDSPTGLEAALLARIPVAAVTTNFPAETLATPVLGRPDLKPIWIGPSIRDFFTWLKSLPTESSL